MRLMLKTAACAAVLALGACAGGTAYVAADGGPRAMGFSDYRIETGRYRVTFQGGPGAPPEQVSDLALRRAAEVSLRDGYDWFRIVDRMGERDGSGGGTRLGVGGGSGGYGGGVGVGASFDLSGGPRYRQTLEILAGRGARPAEAYDAREVAGVGL